MGRLQWELYVSRAMSLHVSGEFLNMLYVGRGSMNIVSDGDETDTSIALLMVYFEHTGVSSTTWWSVIKNLSKLRYD